MSVETYELLSWIAFGLAALFLLLTGLLFWWLKIPKVVRELRVKISRKALDSIHEAGFDTFTPNYRPITGKIKTDSFSGGSVSMAASKGAESVTANGTTPLGDQSFPEAATPLEDDLVISHKPQLTAADTELLVQPQLHQSDLGQPTELLAIQDTKNSAFDKASPELGKINFQIIKSWVIVHSQERII